mgnify:CR=1 FL=1
MQRASLMALLGQPPKASAPVVVPLGVPPQRAPSPPLSVVASRSATQLLDALLTRKGRPPLTSKDKPASAELRKRTRKYAVKVAQLLDQLVTDVTAAQTLLEPLTVDAVVRETRFWNDSGAAVQSQQARIDAAYAAASRAMVQSAGGAISSIVVGHLAAARVDGFQVSSKHIASEFGMSVSTVAKGRAVVRSGGELGVFTDMSRRPASQPKRMYSDMECVGWKEALALECPARSGDQQQIFWLTETKEEFYYQFVRSPRGMKMAISCALQADLAAVLAEVADTKGGQWGRNVRLYMRHQKAGTLDTLECTQWRKQLPVLTGDDLVTDLLAATNEHDDDEDDAMRLAMVEQEEERREDKEDDVERLRPRSRHAFYRKLGKGWRFWERPPDDHCKRCARFAESAAEISDLTHLLYGGQLLTDRERLESPLVAKLGGLAKAREHLRRLHQKHGDLEKHVTWKKTQRQYLKTRKITLRPLKDALLYLDYGGLTDSEGKKVSCWSCTVVTRDNPDEHFDICFDARNQHDGEDGWKKDGVAGVFCLFELLRPQVSHPHQYGLLRQVCPEVINLLLSGDTGNGFRGFQMLDSLSQVGGHPDLAGYVVELVPLSPAHAFNPSDARIARLNTHVKKLKRRTRLFGAAGVAEALQQLSDPRLATRLTYLPRSHVLFRKVTEVASLMSYQVRPGQSAALVHRDLPGGKIGVRGLLYFGFLLGDGSCRPGCALTREYGDVTVQGAAGAQHFYTWRKEIAATICQYCSDDAVRSAATSFISVLHVRPTATVLNSGCPRGVDS